MNRHPIRTLTGIPSTRSLWFLLRQETKALTAVPGEVVVEVFLSPLGYLFLLGAGISGMLAGGSGSNEAFLANLWFMVPGIVAIQAFFAISASMYRLQADRQSGMMAMKLVQGVRPVVYTVSIFAIPLVRFLAQVIVLLTAAWVLGIRMTASEVGLVVMVGVIAAVTWLAVGGLLVFLVRKQTNRAVVMRVLSLPLMFSAPTFYPLESMPAYLRTLAFFNPLTYHLELMRGSVQIGPSWLLWPVVLALLIVSTVTLTVLVSIAQPLPAQDNV